MTFLAAGWLWLLMPWSLLAIWCWRRPAATREVTARFLWGSNAASPDRASPRRVPPAWSLLLLIALLIVIASMSRVAVRARTARVILVVDPFISLSARQDGTTRLARAFDSIPVEAATYRIAGRPGGVSREAARSPRFTGRPTEEAVSAAIERALAEADAVIALTDAAVPIRADRLVIVTPPPLDNAGIVFISIAPIRREEGRGTEDETSSAQLMVRLANFGPARAATLRVASAEFTAIARAIDLPPGQSTQFVDLPVAAGRIEVRLDVPDDPLPIDNVASLVRVADWPRLSVEGDLPEAARRFASAYTRRRPGDGMSVRLTDRETADAAIRFAPPTEPMPAGERRVGVHPVADDVDFAAMILRAVAPPPAGEWTPIVTVAGRPLVAARERPARQVWVGVPLDEADLTSVLLLTNAVDWIADGRPGWSAFVPADVGRDWQPVEVDASTDGGPGRYLDSAGRMVAVNVPAVGPRGGRPTGDLDRLLAEARRRSATPIPPAVLAGTAAGLLLIAAGLIRRARPS